MIEIDLKDERTKAKLRILGMIIIRVAIYVTIAGYLYNGAIGLINAGWNPWIAGIGGLTMLIIMDWAMHKILYNRMNKYILDKNKGIQLFTINENTPQWKREFIEGMIKPQQAIFGEKWNTEGMKNAYKRYQTQDIQQQSQTRRIHRNNNRIQWED